MEKVTHNEGTRKKVNEFSAIVPTWRAPVIVRSVVKNGATFYKGANGKLYVPRLYDAMFKAAKGVLKDRFYKGENPGEKY